MPMSKSSRYAIGGFLVVLLAIIRAFESSLFYDPLTDYFRGDYTANPLPGIDTTLLSLHLTFRYFLNSIISLGIIWIAFRKWGMVKFAATLYLILFIFLIILFLSAYSWFSEYKMLIFYIRRFIIHPIFLLLFLPAFYFQEKVASKQ